MVEIDEQSEKFRKLIEGMYEGFPNVRVSEEEVKEVIVTERDLSELVKSGYFIEEPVSNGEEKRKFFGLGPNSLGLIAAWSNEEMSKKVVNLTYIVLGIGYLTLMTNVLGVYINPNMTLSTMWVLPLISLAGILILFLAWLRMAD